MSLWDGIREVGGFVKEAAQQRQERIMRYKVSYSNLDDKELFRRYKNSSNGEIKIACGLLLKERGYGSSNTDESDS